MARGDLVSDAILLGMLEDRFSRPDTANGFILDGYPRNLAQADALDDAARRASASRWIARCSWKCRPNCWSSASPAAPQAEGRADDNPESVRKRLRDLRRARPRR